MPLRAVFLVLAIALFAGPRPGPAVADSTADCGRFFLKKDKKTGRMKCVGKKRKRRGTVSARAIRLQQQAVQQIISRAQNLSSGEDISPEQARQARALIIDARLRIDEIRRQTQTLRREQEAFTEEIANAARQRTRAQQEQSRRLEQQQRDLVRQLLAQQRQLQQSLQRNRQAFRRNNQRP